MEPEGSLLHSQQAATCPVHASPFHFCEDPFYPNPSTSMLSKWALSPRTPPPKVRTSPLTHTYYIPRPSHSSRFDHPNNILWAEEIIKLTFM